jgi:hypothetical protein
MAEGSVNSSFLRIAARQMPQDSQYDFHLLSYLVAVEIILRAPGGNI